MSAGPRGGGAGDGDPKGDGARGDGARDHHARDDDGVMAAEGGWLVRGRVQGVGFRWWTRHHAEDLGLTGSVENLPDGSVRVMARGPRAALDRFEAALRDGPPVARVEGTEDVPVDLSADARGFRILR